MRGDDPRMEKNNCLGKHVPDKPNTPMNNVNWTGPCSGVHTTETDP